MNKTITLCCEGEKGKRSYDHQILDKVTEDSDSSCFIKPLGSIRGAPAIVQYLKRNSATQSNFYIFFRDRDFDKPIPSTPDLEIEQQNKDYAYCFSYRITIENYLFDSEVMYQFIIKNKLAKEYSIDSEQTVKTKFIEAAEKIKYYQAARHALGQMRMPIDSFKTKWTDKSGILPSHLDEAACLENGWKSIDEALGNIAKTTKKWSKEKFDKTFYDYLAKFDKPFMDELNFLVWFQGKDFAASLTKYVLSKPTFNMDDYYKFAINNFDYKKYPDLVELHKFIGDKSKF